jgi:type I restriction enzyme S subunit
VVRMMFYKETNFKETPIGKIPKDWELRELRELVKADKFAIVDGPFGTQLHSSEYVTQGIPLIRVDNINKDGSFNPNNLVYITEEKWEKLKRSAIFPGDILLAKTGATIGKVCLFPEDFEKGLIASSCAKISIDPSKAYNRYIFYFLLSNFGYFQILASATGSTRPAINLTPIGKVKIAIPKNVKEQQKIAEILSTVDEAIQKTNEIIAKTERLKKGLMQELLTKGIGHKEFKDTEIGKLPKNWEVVKLGDVVTYRKGVKPKVIFDRRGPNTLPYLTADDVRAGIFTKWTRESGKIVKVNKDDIILIWDGFYCGDAFIGLEGILSSTMIKIDPKSNLNGRFLFYILKTHFKELNTKISGMYLKHVNKSVFENLKLPLPPLQEQQKIVEILSTIDKKLEVEKNEKAKLERIKQGLMDLLLAGKIRVKVVNL